MPKFFSPCMVVKIKHLTTPEVPSHCDLCQQRSLELCWEQVQLNTVALPLPGVQSVCLKATDLDRDCRFHGPT